MADQPSPTPVAENAESRRAALVVAVSEYADTTLRQLRSPSGDAAEFGQVLGSPDLGGFDVTTVVDERAHEIRLAVEDFLHDVGPGDLALVYLSCHGLVDVRRRLYFAAADTLKDRLASTGVEARWLLDQLEECRARRQVVILDCCFSGAFAPRTKGDNSVRLGDELMGEGRGRVVLTASRATEYSFEGAPTQDSTIPGSVFTAALATGIRTGAADADADGYISVDDAYTYAFDEMRASGVQQTPQRWLYGAEGDIVLARNPTATGTGGAIPTRRPGSTVTGSGPLIGAGPPAGSAGWTPPRWWRGSRTWLIGAAATMVVAIVGAGVSVWLLGRGGDEFSFHDDRYVDSSVPWRVSVSPDIDAPSDGCQVFVHREDASGETVAKTRFPSGEDNVLLQVGDTGSFYLDYPNGCVIVPQKGSGDSNLPVTLSAGVGDSEAWNPTGPLKISVVKTSAAACSVFMMNAETDTPADKLTIAADRPETYKPPATSSLYMRAEATDCVMRADTDEQSS